MKLTKDLMPFLEGKLLSAVQCFDWSMAGQETGTRIDLILKLTKNKNVLHLGACDHFDCIESKRENHEWLHDLLNENCSHVIGIDINEEMIDYCHGLGVDNIVYANVLEPKDKHQIQKYFDKYIKNKNSDENKDIYWDYMVAGEILEHIGNPVSFLSGIRKNYSDIVKKIIITVPNAMRWYNISSAKKGIEVINTDHRFWFTPYTLCKVCEDAKLTIEDIYLVESPKTVKRGEGGAKVFIKSLLKYILIPKKNIMYESIVLVADFGNECK